MDTKAECDRLNLAYVAEKKYKKETKTNKHQWFSTGSRSVTAVQQESERLWSMDERTCERVWSESDRQLQLCHS